jgi:hypothetical protein
MTGGKHGITAAHLRFPKQTEAIPTGITSLLFASNGTDRIDFICTEAHPRDYNTSIYHGYIQAGQSFNSQGDVIDADIFDQEAPDPSAFTPVFTATPEDGVNDASEYHRAWTVELEHDRAGNIYALFTTRYGTEVSSNASGDADHRLFYARLDFGETEWAYTELCKMGIPLDPREQDYTGLGAIHPNRPEIVFVSTPFNPSTGASTQRWEIYRGESTDNGSTWQWTTITGNSSVDNFRPVIPSWDSSNTAVLWLRGEYVWQHEFDQTVVGLVQRDGQSAGSMTYLDASASNTELAAGGPLNATGPGGAMGSADDLWHWRTSHGNGSTVLTSAESGGEDAPALRSRFEGLEPGTYEVWGNFWANPEADWRVRAGLSADGTLLFRHKACQQIDSSAYDAPVTRAGEGNVFLYQGYLGRVEISAGGMLDVYIDDDAVETGTASTLVGNTTRTWYDGASVSAVNPPTAVKFEGGKSSPFLYHAANTITMDIADPGTYSLSLFGLDGAFLSSLFSGYLQSGRQTIHWEPPNTLKGLFILRLEKSGHYPGTSITAKDNYLVIW